MDYVEYIPNESAPWRKFYISKAFSKDNPPKFNDITGDTPSYKISYRSHALRDDPATFYEITAEATEFEIKAHIDFEEGGPSWYPTVRLGAYFATRSSTPVLVFSLYGVNSQGAIFDATYRITRSYTESILTTTGSYEVEESHGPASDGYPWGIPWFMNGTNNNSYPELTGNDLSGHCYLDIDMPVFADEQAFERYVLTGDLSECLNFYEEYDVETTELYWIYNQIGSAKITYGNVDVLSNSSWKSMKFYANKPPCFYLDSDEGFSCSLLAGGVVSSIGMNGPSYLLDNVPESQWRSQELFFTNGFYGNIGAYKTAFDKIPSNSTYTYGTTWDTNIPIFKNQSDAEDYQDGTKGVEDAVNFSEISNYYEGGNKTGLPENATVFGDVYTKAFFSQMYLCTDGAIQEVSNALFDYDVPTLSGIWTQIKIGLEMYGTNPMEVIQGLRYYPFDLSQCFSGALDQNYLWIGAYNLSMTHNVKKVIYPNGYIDLGTVKIERAYNDWRDFEPYTKCYVYLPYVGKFPIDLSRYYGKQINLRYYIDIRSGACCACLIANGVLLDWYDGIIGTDMPITLTDYSSFANAQINTIMRNMGLGIGGEAVVGSKGVDVMKSAITYSENADAIEQAARMSPLKSSLAAQTAGSYGTQAIAAAGIAGGAALGLVAAGTVMKTQFEMLKNGTSGYTKGRPSSSSMINQYLPQYAMFIFECMEIDESPYLNELYGRPTNKSGTIGSFSGYLQADDVMLICPIATDNERQEIIDLVRAGIYI